MIAMFRRGPRAERVAGGFEFLEGPVWIPGREELIFSDIPASRLYRLRGETIEVVRAPSGNANGNTLDGRGRLVTCEHGTRRVSRTEDDGSVTTLATHYHSRRLNSPNDVVVRKRDEAIYFTDPPYGVRAEDRELEFQGVFRIEPTAQADDPRLLRDDFDKPNGLAFSPDESLLYVADTERGHVRVFEVEPDGGLRGGRVFCRVERPDGMRVDTAGHLWIAAKTGIEGFDAGGARRHRLRVPEQPANLAFGGADRRTLYVTARQGLYRIPMETPGVP